MRRGFLADERDYDSRHSLEAALRCQGLPPDIRNSLSRNEAMDSSVHQKSLLGMPQSFPVHRRGHAALQKLHGQGRRRELASRHRVSAD